MTLTIHQQAIHALLELGLSTLEFRAAFPDVEPSVPRSQVPALFRAAIAVPDPYREETAILETALMLLEHAKDENRTPEQEEFYSTLAFKWEADHTFRVLYAPGNLRIN
jgi:hypothetical protein